jgi:hypothetical protein
LANSFVEGRRKGLEPQDRVQGAIDLQAASWRKTPWRRETARVERDVFGWYRHAERPWRQGRGVDSALLDDGGAVRDEPQERMVIRRDHKLWPCFAGGELKATEVCV